MGDIDGAGIGRLDEGEEGAGRGALVGLRVGLSDGLPEGCTVGGHDGIPDGMTSSIDLYGVVGASVGYSYILIPVLGAAVGLYDFIWVVGPYVGLIDGLVVLFFLQPRRQQ